MSGQPSSSGVRDLRGHVAPGVPRLPRTYVQRADLWRRLDASADTPMTTLVAPAGAGKTLGVAGWLRRGHLGDSAADAIWLDAGPALDDVRLDAALREASASCGPGGSAPRRLVIDGAHQLPPSALRLLDTLLNETPQDIRVLLLGRWDMPFTRLAPRLLGHLDELRGDVLRLSDAESAHLIEQHVGAADPEVVSAIVTQAEGWCAVVVLASRLAASSPNPAAAVRRLSHGNAKIADQVASEVFATLTSRERHLLLCIASEGEVTKDVAAHLTRDQGAGVVLEGLEATGLLVSRSDPSLQRSGSASDIGRGDVEERFRIHPLLVEAVRRRVVAGGVDVERARSTVLRAVRLDVGRGTPREAFGRLVDLGLAEDAAQHLVDEGTGLLMRGRDKDVVAFAQRWPEVVEAHPESWFVLAVERWIHRDVPSAMHWFDRLFEFVHRDAAVSDRLKAHHLCAHLMRARAGFESMEAIAQEAQSLVDSPSFSSTPADLQPHVLGELGIVQLALGRFAPAESNLLRAAQLGDKLDLPAHAAAALTHLAGLYYMRGREDVVARLTAQSAASAQRLGLGVPVVQHRAELFAQLSAMSSLPLTPVPTGEQVAPPDAVLHPADMTARFWRRIYEARSHLSQGSVIRAERSLRAAMDVDGLADHLRATALIERGFLAALCDDFGTVRTLAHELHDLGSTGEALLMRGVGADLAGDLRGAVDHFAAAAESVVLDQPPCRTLALVCGAQLLHALGDQRAAGEAMAAAVRSTESRGNYVPFLGWSRHGTQVHTLLGQLEGPTRHAWLSQLVELTRQQPDITSALAPSTPTSRELSGAEPLVTTRLSPRERDVLRELARGATYADIASGLFVSENTVKTHVSSLYSKLGASRRSEALSVARRLELL